MLKTTAAAAHHLGRTCPVQTKPQYECVEWFGVHGVSNRQPHCTNQWWAIIAGLVWTFLAYADNANRCCLVVPNLCSKIQPGLEVITTVFKVEISLVCAVPHAVYLSAVPTMSIHMTHLAVGVWFADRANIWSPCAACVAISQMGAWASSAIYLHNSGHCRHWRGPFSALFVVFIAILRQTACLSMDHITSL